ncbi:pleckstrin homology domain-containing family A member 6 isoform X3 [Microcaecilia unicolor]|uniref:Pleckstrin homology domain-containing family A member 6 isoform X3 n=1 Tax=Microcaecilia unicolor TaxID=1415580 RepID=A0A6P7ZG73_9AMPH|nr:pleckstrin homology domain-containing family A member 6 isoform X3 [Microcaecilia unicolor]
MREQRDCSQSLGEGTSMAICPGKKLVTAEKTDSLDLSFNHNDGGNSFLHPVTRQIPDEKLQSSALDMSNKAVSLSSEASSRTMVSEESQERSSGKSSQLSRKGRAFGKRSNSMKRNPNAEVAKSGWLSKQASSGVKQWNKRWFVLVDRCLFYYKDEKEEGVLGSIPLLSFRIAAVQPSDNITRKYTFKAEHAGIRTYFFSAESREEQESWIQAMSEASHIQIHPQQRSEQMASENVPPGRTHHSYSFHKGRSKVELETKTRGEGDGRGSEKIERRSEGIENKTEFLPKSSGLGAEREVMLQPGNAAVERPPQPNGWQYPSPSRPGSTAYPSQGMENMLHQHGILPRTNPEKMAQRKSSMAQLQHWVNLRRGAPSSEEVQSSSRLYPMSRGAPDYYSVYHPQYPEDSQYYPPGVRPDSICSMPAFDRLGHHWTMEEKPHSFHNGIPWKDHPGYVRQQEVPVWVPGMTRQQEVPLWAPMTGRQSGYYDEMDAAVSSMHRLSLQPRSRSVPRSPSQGSYANNRGRLYSPVRSPSARFDRIPPQSEDMYVDPAAHMMRHSISSPKYEYLGERGSLAAGRYPYNYPVSPTLHDKMVSPFSDPYQEALQPYKINEQDTDKLLGKLCEQHKVVREQEQLVQQLRAEKESLESALMATHQEMEMFGSQPAYPEKLRLKKEALQNQLINIRVELSQATTALSNSRLEYENLQSDVSRLQDELWEQLNLDVQNEALHRQIQKETWRIQDVMEGLRKNNPSRGTDTAKYRVAGGLHGTYSSNSPASPLSSASLTSPLSPFSLVSGSQGSPTKQTANEELGPPRPPLPKSYVPLESPLATPPPLREGRLWPWLYPNVPSWQQSGEAKRGQLKLSFEPHKKEMQQTLPHLLSEELSPPQPCAETAEAEKPVAVNKVGIVPPRTKSPSDQDPGPSSSVVRRGSNSQLSRVRPKSAVFSSDLKAKMSVEEQIARMKRHQSGSMKEKRRSLQLPSSQQSDPSSAKPSVSYRVVRRHRSIHEVDISDLEAALRSEESNHSYETPRDEIARLRQMELEPQHYHVDISKELSTPDKVVIPERYIELEPENPLSPEELKEKQKKVERIKTLIAKSSLQNVVPASDREPDEPADSESQLQEQEKRIALSCTLATEASRRGRLLSVLCSTPSPPTSPVSSNPQNSSLWSEPPSHSAENGSGRHHGPYYVCLSHNA